MKGRDKEVEEGEKEENRDTKRDSERARRRRRDMKGVLKPVFSEQPECIYVLTMLCECVCYIPDVGGVL